MGEAQPGYGVIVRPPFSLPATGAVPAQRVGENGTSKRILTQKDPMAWARALVAEEYVLDQHRTLQRWRGQFYQWTGARYEALDVDAVKAEAWAFLEASYTRGEDKEGKPVYRRFKPTRGAVADMIEALGAVCALRSTVAAPAWLDAGDHLPPDEILVVRNGLLHLPSGALLKPSPAYFTLNATDIVFDPDAPRPAEWHDFLEMIFVREDGRVDQEAMDTLQDWCGYCLLPDTTQQKILLLIGPPRSGKGTLMSILKETVGRVNVVAPTLDGLGASFGLEPLIDKTLAMIGDARLSGRSDQAAIVENLLSISGEDPRTIGRKYLPAWTGQLQVRFLISTNVVPSLADASGALASRFIVITLDRSFVGREDLGLKDRLLAELPGILNWAREGYLRLRERGYFVQPASSAEKTEDLRNQGSPVAAFVEDRCERGPGFEVGTDRLFEAWQVWCAAQGEVKAGAKNRFGVNLKAAVPGLRQSQPRDGDARARVYSGIRLKWSAD